MLIDTHCHLYYEDLKNDIYNVINRASDLGVNKFICVSTNLNDAEECIELAKNFEPIWATAGIHPHDAKSAPIKFENKLKSLLNNKKIVAVGEIGLDYFRGLTDQKIQKKYFRKQLEIAAEMDLPIVFHNREADEDIISILSDFPGLKGVAHCFSSTIETAEKLIELGFLISFSGNLTFKNSKLPEVASKISLRNLLVETDSPYLSPTPFRGKPNEPARVRYVAEKLADINNCTLEEVAKRTSENAIKLFNIV
ncbi:MAG: TatD family hydrolase [Candidatus Marinimicrobia bacterium]|nr:TatD family hydrolase [Candidatus Neomarinimicrobiota bacterium]